MTSRLILCLLTVVASSLVVRADAPRYRWQPGAQFVYQVLITADTPIETETMSGYVVFDVVSPSEPLKLKYRGGLSKTTKKKPVASSGRGGPFRGPGIGPGLADPLGPGDPFARRVNPFKGLEQTSNEIVLSPTGEILAVTGSSQLPNLLGNLSLLFFEPLPDTDLKTWKVESGITITEKAEQRGCADFFDPFARRGGNEQDKQSAGGQATSFTLKSENDGLAVYQRTYRLNSPSGDASFTIDGSGPWTFNRNLGMPESLDFKQTLRIKSDNIEFSVPVTIKYERLPAAAWAKLEKDRLAREDALRKMAEQRTAAEKAAAAAPIVGEMRNKILATLRSGQQSELAKTLAALAKKTAREDDELAKLIQPHLDHGEKGVADLARHALAAFSPTYKRVYDLNRAYKKSYPVTEVGLWISYDTPLPPGLVVAANSYHRSSETIYLPATVVQQLDGGLVKVRYQDRGTFTEDRLREDMFLAPPDVEQPNLTAEQLAALRAYEAQVRQSIRNSSETEALIRAYRDGDQPLPKVGDPVPAGLSLPRFLVLAAKRDNQWYQSHVSKELPDGSVAVRISGSRFDATLPRSDLRLPPPEVKAPNLKPPYATSSSSSAAEETAAAFRTWSDATGKFKIEAKLLENLGESVRLVRKDGKEIVVPLARLSESDQKFVASLAKTSNPFDP